jgi:hypothetical protein
MDVLTKEDRMRGLLVGLMLVLLNGCMGFTTIEHPIEGDKPVTFVKDAEGRIVKATVADEHYVVLTRGTVDSWTVDQDHSQDLKHCRHKYTSEEMAAIRTARPHTGAVSWYYGCTYMVKPQLAKDSSKIEKTAGIAMAGAIGYAGHAIGRGLGKSGTTVNQEGGGAESNSDADASSNSDADANASHQQNVGNKTTNIKPSTNINSNNVIKTK